VESKENTVAVHIRRGDYLLAGTELTIDYFYHAMQLVEERLGKVTYCFFSDDIDWVRENFGEKENYLFLSGIEGTTYLDEYACMCRCSHYIIANSSFSWWPAYLNADPDKIVIAPKVSFWRGDFYPESWITLESVIEQEVVRG
jgi:hypothetical protein